jgi:hypothetical protein
MTLIFGALAVVALAIMVLAAPSYLYYRWGETPIPFTRTLQVSDVLFGLSWLLGGLFILGLIAAL